MTSGDVLTVLSLAVGVGTPFTVGLVLLLRGVGTRVAWILLAGALSIVVVFGAHVIGTPWALVVGSEWTVLFLWPLALAYVYPDGRLPSRRWRPMAIVAAVSGAGTLLLLPLQPTLEGPDGDVKNPIQIGPGLEDLLTPVFWACWFGLLAALFGGALSQRARYKAGSARAAAPGPVARLRRGASRRCGCGGTSLIGLFVSFDAARRRGADAPARVARGRRRRRGDAPRPVRDRPALQPHARLRGADRAAGRHLRARRRCSPGSSAGGSAFAAVGGARSRRRSRSARCATACRRSSTGASPASGSRACGCCATSSTTSATAAPSRRTSARRSRSRSTTRGAEVVFRLPETGAYADRGGRLLDALPDDGRARTPIGRDRRSACCCTTRRSRAGPTCCTRCSTPRPSRSRSRRLRVELRLQLAEVESSRARIAQAGYAERRRLERDLHDGAQQRLVTLGIVLRRLQRSLPARGADRSARRSTPRSTRSRRRSPTCARSRPGVRPPRLDEGLAAALEDLARGAAVPVELEATGDRAPPEVEAVAYFVACEALTNAVKHASPSRVTVADRARATASCGSSSPTTASAAPRRRRAAGSPGMADRVAAQGGTLALESPPGAGTRIAVELPCAS